MNCPDCNVEPGEEHQPGCDVERCSVCKGQFISCGHDDHDPSKTKWDGEWPGTAECRERVWFAKETPGGPFGHWTPCLPNTPGAIHDMNRLAHFHATGKDDLYPPEATKPLQN
jgi:hypothetical protein